MENRPQIDLEIVRDLEMQGVNFAISNKKLINCKFTSCNLLYGGGDFHIEECNISHCSFIKTGPVAEALNNVDAEQIKQNLIKSWDRLKVLWGARAGVDDKGNINLGKANT